MIVKVGKQKQTCFVTAQDTACKPAIACSTVLPYHKYIAAYDSFGHIHRFKWSFQLAVCCLERRFQEKSN